MPSGRMISVWLRLKSLFRRRALDRDLRDEIEAHLGEREERLRVAGMPAEEAAREARRKFGNVLATRESLRESWTFASVEILRQDVRHALRGFLRAPGFTLTAALALALGVGATTSVFSVVDRILFRALPYAQADRLVSWGMTAPIEPTEFMLGFPYLQLRREPNPFEAVTSLMPATASCDVTEQNPVRLHCQPVESTFLPTFGVAPLLGRNFTPEEDQPNVPKVALISFGLWKSRYAGDPGVLGKSIQLDGQPAKIIGVLPSDFELPTLGRADILLPQQMNEAAQTPNSTRLIRTFGRLKPGVSIEQAKAQLAPYFDDFVRSAPPSFVKEIHISVRSIRDREIGDVRVASLVLLGAVIALLLIACANVASLLLARAASRQRELAVRAALGAGRARLMRQTLTESLLLALAGGGAGCLLAEALLRAFVAIAPQGIPRLEQARLDGRVLLFALGVSFLCGILFGLVPALHRPRHEYLAARSLAGAGHNGFRQALVAAQIAVSLVLLAGSSLLFRTLWNLSNQALGMQPGGVLTVSLNLGRKADANPAGEMAFFEEVEARLKALPGVGVLALADTIPPGGAMHARPYAGIEVEGQPKFEQGTGGMVAWRSVTPGYFAALRIPLLQGRAFDEDDRNFGARALILSEKLARRLFSEQNPIGRQIRFVGETQWRTVVGVAADVKNGGLFEAGDPEYYLPWRRAPDEARSYATLVIRTPLDPAALARWIRPEIAALDPTLPFTMQTMSDRVSSFADRPRFDAALFGMFALMGVLLAAVGLYGVMAFLVTQRTQEIGLRMALGASQASILGLFIGKAWIVIALGAAAGLLAALAASRVLGSLLYGVKPDDPATFALVVGLLAAVATLACYFPARRASKIDPMVALRYE